MVGANSQGPRSAPPPPEIRALTPPPGPSPLTLALPVALLERARVGQAAAGPIVRGPCGAAGGSTGGPFRTSTRTGPSAQTAPERRQREAGRRGRRRRQSHEGGRRRRRRPCGRRASGQDVPHGRLQGERSEGEGQGPCARGPVPAKPRSAPGPGSHWRRRLHPAWAPLPPRAPRATEPAAAAASTVAPPHLAHWFSMPWDPPTSFKAWPCNWSQGWESHPPLWDVLFYWLPLTGRSRHTPPPLPLARGDRIYWLATPRVPVFGCHWSALRTLKRPLTRRLRPFPEGALLSTPPRGEIATVTGRLWPSKHPDWLSWVQEADPGDVIGLVRSLANVPGSRDTGKGALRGRGC